MDVPHVGTWRDAAAYEPILFTGLAGLAWEVLRRNSNYRPGTPSLTLAAADQPMILSAADAGSTERWGLHFPGESRSARR